MGPEKPKILVVDDNQGIRQLFQHILSEDYEIITAESGEQALEVYKGNKDISLLITDLQMPLMDGFELSKQIKLKGYLGPAIMITTHIITPELRNRANSHGIDSLIDKYEINKSKDLIKKIIQESQQHINYSLIIP